MTNPVNPTDPIVPVEGTKETEESKETKGTESAPKVPTDTSKKEESANNEEQKRIKQLEDQISALKGDVSNRDKKLNEKTEEEKTVAQKLLEIEDKLMVKDLILEEDLPKEIKDALKADKSLNSTNLAEKRDLLMGVYNKGVASVKKEVINDTQTDPTKSKNEDAIKSFKKDALSGTYKSDRELLEAARKLPS